MLGTLRYLSPEQANGPSRDDRRPDRRLWAGATLYELLTLRLSRATIEPSYSSKRIEGGVFRAKLDAAIPVDLKTIVLKVLAKPGRTICDGR